MDTKEWIASAGVTIGFLSLICTIYNIWLNLRRAKKEVEQPHYRMGRNKSWLSKPRASYLVSTLSILALLPFQIIVLLDHGPVTRLTIVLISFYVSVILFHLIMMVIAHIESKIYDSINDIRDTDARQGTRKEDTNRDAS